MVPTSHALLLFTDPFPYYTPLHTYAFSFSDRPWAPPILSAPPGCRLMNPGAARSERGATHTLTCLPGAAEKTYTIFIWGYHLSRSSYGTRDPEGSSSPPPRRGAKGGGAGWDKGGEERIGAGSGRGRRKVEGRSGEGQGPRSIRAVFILARPRCTPSVLPLIASPWATLTPPARPKDRPLCTRSASRGPS